jgi:2-dehydro-3-deoxyphosphooctonate aldolase (KDO 8-P synthase)
METHPDPANAKSDGPNAMPTQRLKDLLIVLQQIDQATKAGGFLENELV